MQIGKAANIGVVGMASIYTFEAYDKNGNLKWTETVHNLVVNAGLDDLLSKYFKGSSYTAAFYVGLKGSGTVADTDTIASHSGWTEVTDYSGNRQALTLGSVSSQSVDNSASKAAFAINATVTVAGAFVATVATGTSGTLYGAADFGSSRSLEDGDTLNVTVTLTSAAS